MYDDYADDGWAFPEPGTPEFGVAVTVAAALFFLFMIRRGFRPVLAG